MVLSPWPLESFRNVNVYPTKDEIHNRILGDRNTLRKNIIDGGFQSVDEYLHIQFSLLREDFVANLSEAIESYQKKKNSKGIQIYKDVQIRIDCRKAYQECLKIDVSIQNESDKNDRKFMAGSLLLFTLNNFNDMFLAKVIRRMGSEVTIDLINVDFCVVSLDCRYVMAECSKYFDPYFNVLNALQSIQVWSFPMEKYIISVDNTSVYMPPYLLRPGLMYEIDGYRFAPTLLPRMTTKLLGLNTYQFEAFKAALTQEFAVIQGPPGTGKTHLGVKIASTLIQNSHLWYKNTPLLIVSHKNDALDQFLEGLIPTTDRLIRVGGQSKSEKLKEFNLGNDKWRELKKRSPVRVLQQALVVGMTTSIAARWREQLEELKAPIMIVEEAAEILEGHVIAALTQHCKHLILMGDHQQLQPISADHNIGKNYHLGVSLFERMVRNGVQHFQLKTQHRMRPQISELLRVKIYPFLEDHESVQQRPDIRGVEKNVFFMDHNHGETTVNYTTKKNDFEAQFLVCFARYLVLNGYNNGEVVILATYAAQLKELERLVENQPLMETVRLSTLDGFQGQESDIVLLSLVRSDEIGFLGKENRVCVALSRAKNGLYILGNMGLLSRSSRLWTTIRKCLEKQKALGRKLVLKCQNHQNLTEIQSQEDFFKIQNGGCCRKCAAMLTCGHICSFMCHNDVIEHKCEKGCLTTDSVSEVDYTNLWRPPRSMEPSGTNNSEQNRQNGSGSIFGIIICVIILEGLRRFWNMSIFR